MRNRSRSQQAGAYLCKFWPRSGRTSRKSRPRAAPHTDLAASCIRTRGDCWITDRRARPPAQPTFHYAHLRRRANTVPTRLSAVTTGVRQERPQRASQTSGRESRAGATEHQRSQQCTVGTCRNRPSSPRTLQTSATGPGSCEPASSGTFTKDCRPTARDGSDAVGPLFAA